MREHRDRARPLPLPGKAIAVFYLFSTSSTIVSYLLVQSGWITLSPEQAAHLQKNSASEHALTLITATVEMMGASALLLGYPRAWLFFAVALTTTLALAVVRGSAYGLFAALGGAGIFATLLGWALLASVCVYTWKLQAGTE